MRSPRFWLPLLLLVWLVASLADSFDHRTRGWLGYGKFHLG